MAAPEKQAKAAADEVSVEVAEGVVRTQRTDDELFDVYPQTPSVRLSENAAAAAALPDAAVPEAAGSFKKVSDRDPSALPTSSTQRKPRHLVSRSGLVAMRVSTENERKRVAKALHHKPNRQFVKLEEETDSNRELEDAADRALAARQGTQNAAVEMGAVGDHDDPTSNELGTDHHSIRATAAQRKQEVWCNLSERTVWCLTLWCAMFFTLLSVGSALLSLYAITEFKQQENTSSGALPPPLLLRASRLAPSSPPPALLQPSSPSAWASRGMKTHPLLRSADP